MLYSVRDQHFLSIHSYDRCNISQIFNFFVQFQCPILHCAIHLYSCFSGGFKIKQRGRKVSGQGCWVIMIYFKIFGLFNFSHYLWTSFLLVHNQIYYHYYQYLHYYYHYYCYGYFLIHTINIIIQIIIPLKAIYQQNNGMFFLAPLFDQVLLFNVFCFCFIIIVVIIINSNILLLLLLLLSSFVLSSILFVYVCIALYPLYIPLLTFL